MALDHKKSATSKCHCWEEKLYSTCLVENMQNYAENCEKHRRSVKMILHCSFFKKKKERKEKWNLIGLNVESFCNINREHHSATDCLSRGRRGYVDVLQYLITAYFISAIYFSPCRKSQVAIAFRYNNSMELKNRRQSCFIDHIYNHTRKYGFQHKPRFLK